MCFDSSEPYRSPSCLSLRQPPNRQSRLTETQKARCNQNSGKLTRGSFCNPSTPCQVEVRVTVWNETLANLSLMALCAASQNLRAFDLSVGACSPIEFLILFVCCASSPFAARRSSGSGSGRLQIAGCSSSSSSSSSRQSP